MQNASPPTGFGFFGGLLAAALAVYAFTSSSGTDDKRANPDEERENPADERPGSKPTRKNIWADYDAKRRAEDEAAGRPRANGLKPGLPKPTDGEAEPVATGDDREKEEAE